MWELRLRCTAPAVCPDRVHEGDAIGGTELLVAIRRLDEQRSDAPCLVMPVMIHTVEQLNRRTVVEDLASVSRWVRVVSFGRAAGRMIEILMATPFPHSHFKTVQFWCHADDLRLPVSIRRPSLLNAVRRRCRSWQMPTSPPTPAARAGPGGQASSQTASRNITVFRREMESTIWIRTCYLKNLVRNTHGSTRCETLDRRQCKCT